MVIGIGRRNFITGLGAATAWPLAAHAQLQPKMLRVGIVWIGPRTLPYWVAFDQRMHELGYVEGENLTVEFLDLNGRIEGFDEGMKELIRRKVDIIIALGAEAPLKAAMTATQTTPIVVAAIDYDPLALGYVSGLARPAGNVTGVVFQQIELTMKRLELLKDAFPQIQALTVFWDQLSAHQWEAVPNTATSLGLRLAGVELRGQPRDYEQALTQAPPEYRSALFVLASPLFFADRWRLAELALRHRMVSMFAFREYVEAGGLFSYGPSLNGLMKRAADYVDQIARGKKTTDLPIEQPTKFELIVNLKTAKSLGVTISQSFVLLADGVIE